VPTGVAGSSTPGSGSVSLSWTAGSTPDGGPYDGYYVQRFAGATPSYACASSPSSLLPATPTSCVDSGVSEGTYTYVVTAVFHTWTATSNPSFAVTVTNTVPTTTTMASSLNPSYAGQSTTYTATVSPNFGVNTPTGTVTFEDGGVAISTCGSSGVVTLSGGVASCTVPYLSAGSHSISGAYSGDTGFGASTSNTVAQTVNSVAVGTWIGAAVTNNWSDCNNWAAYTCPTSASTLTFNGTSTKDAVVDASFAGTVANTSINSGYTGTVTLGRSLTVSGTYSQATGTFSAVDQPLSVAAFSLTGGVFTASSGTTSVSGSLTVSGSPAFSANGGTFNFGGATAGALSCNNVSFNLVTLTNTALVKTVNSNCTLPLGNAPLADGGGSITLTGGTLSGTGTLTTSGTLTLNAGGTLSGFSGLAASSLTVAGATFNAGSYSPLTVSVAFAVSSGSFTAPSGTMSVAAGFTISGSPTFNANGGTLNFNGATAGTLACSVNTFNLVTFTHTAAAKTVTTCSFPLGASPLANSGGSITLTGGTLSGGGTLTTSGTLTLKAGATLSGFSGLAASSLTVSGATFNAGSYSPFTASATFTLSSGTFTAPSGTMSVAGALTISGAPTFNANGGTLNINGATTATLACTVNTFNLVTFTHTAGTKTLTTCNFPLGANPTSTSGGSITLTGGNLTGTGTLTTGGALILNAGGRLSGFTGLSAATLTVSGATLDASGYTTLSTSAAFSLSSGTFTAPNGTMTLATTFGMTGGTFIGTSGTISVAGAFTLSSGSFTATSGTMHLGAALTISGTPTFTANGGTVDFNGTTAATLACTVNNFNLVTFTHTSGIKTVTTCAFPLGANPSANSGGSITLTGGTLNGTGTLTTSGTLILNASATLSGFSGLAATNLTVSGATFNAGTYSPFTVGTAFALSSGTFTAPAATMHVGGAFTISGAPTFTANGGTVDFNGTTTATLACTVNAFNSVTFTHTAGTKTVTTCSLPLGASPLANSGGSITLTGGTLSGSGTLTTSGTLTYTSGTLSGFAGLAASTLTVSGTINVGAYTTFTVAGTFTHTAGTFTAPSGTMSVAGDFTNSGGTFTANTGTVALTGTGQRVSGTTTFYKLSKVVVTADTLTFTAGTTYTVSAATGSLTLQGAAGQRLSLRSSIPGTQWTINATSPRTLGYLDVQDSKNSNATVMAAGPTSVDSGNNTSWTF
jgi:hypothetical protein